MNQPFLSAVLITLNEAGVIERCISSLSFCDEIVVLDSGSSDGTVDIARRMGAQVTVLPGWPGFGPQKNRALDLATGRWVLSIDADETVTPALREEILSAIQSVNPAFRAWRLHRVSSFCGRWIRFGDWRGDKVLRLFERGYARFSDDLVHERVIFDGKVGLLHWPLLHWTMPDLDDALNKLNRYTTAGASQRVLRHRSSGVMRGLLSALWTFVRGWMIRGGFLDGRHGFVLAVYNAQSAFYKYVKAAWMHSDRPRRLR